VNVSCACQKAKDGETEEDHCELYSNRYAYREANSRKGAMEVERDVITL
jgi:hypothetical protein